MENHPRNVGGVQVLDEPSNLLSLFAVCNFHGRLDCFFICRSTHTCVQHQKFVNSICARNLYAFKYVCWLGAGQACIARFLHRIHFVLLATLIVIHDVFVPYIAGKT